MTTSLKIISENKEERGKSKTKINKKEFNLKLSLKKSMFTFNNL